MVYLQPIAASVQGRKRKKGRGRGEKQGRKRGEKQRRQRERQARHLHTTYQGLNYTVLRPEDDYSSVTATTELILWRRRLAELMEGRDGEKGGEETQRWRREESSEPVFSSEHRIAWLCGDPSKYPSEQLLHPST